VEESLRRQYLEAMGIQNWVSREPVPDAATVATEDISSLDRPAATGEPAVLKPDPRSVEQTVPHEQVPTPAEQTGVDRVQSLEERSDIAGLDWEALKSCVEACHACSLHQTRTQTVFGVGNQNADLMIIGEAPGADEDRQGEPFVGRAGLLLNAMLKAIGLDRNQVFIANILKCRPPGNRDPHVDEALCCEPFLQRQIELVKPRVILAVGRVAAQNLLKTDAAVGALRNREHVIGEANIPVVVTYHPAYLLRSPDQKGKAWQDLLRASRSL